MSQGIRSGKRSANLARPPGIVLAGRPGLLKLIQIPVRTLQRHPVQVLAFSISAGSGDPGARSHAGWDGLGRW